MLEHACWTFSHWNVLSAFCFLSDGPRASPASRRFSRGSAQRISRSGKAWVRNGHLRLTANHAIARSRAVHRFLGNSRPPIYPGCRCGFHNAMETRAQGQLLRSMRVCVVHGCNSQRFRQCKKLLCSRHFGRRSDGSSAFMELDWPLQATTILSQHLPAMVPCDLSTAMHMLRQDRRFSHDERSLGDPLMCVLTMCFKEPDPLNALELAYKRRRIPISCGSDLVELLDEVLVEIADVEARYTHEQVSRGRVGILGACVSLSLVSRLWVCVGANKGLLCAALS